jgi:hypothetical protein
MRPRASAALVALLLVLAPAACGDDDGGSSDSTPYIELDGSPRHPDEEGVLVEVADDFSTLTLDGDRTYDVAEDLQCFATQDGATVPLLQRVGEYVQVGIEDDTVVWVASIADVVDGPESDVVYYVGDVVDLVDGALIFDDGTVLQVSAALDLPAPPDDRARITATIDPNQRVVTAVEPAA